MPNKPVTLVLLARELKKIVGINFRVYEYSGKFVSGAPMKMTSLHRIEDKMGAALNWWFHRKVVQEQGEY